MSKKNNDQNQVPEETKEETPEEVTEASQEKQESSQEEALQQALREQEDKYLRLLAEYDNYRKRSQKEKENAWTTARAGPDRPRRLPSASAGSWRRSPGECTPCCRCSPCSWSPSHA